MSRLTKRIVGSAKPDAQRDVFLWDDALCGLGLRVKPNGKRSFFIQDRNPQAVRGALPSDSTAI